ncbi:MAG: sensor histidine kinase [Candidatus Longimicrobiales bacterium M2_2A_002]
MVGSPPPHAPSPSSEDVGGRTLERRLLGWLLALTVAPALLVLAVGGWALGTSLDVAGSLGPWEEVAASGRRVVELAEPVADSALSDAVADHRDALSQSLTQARRWTFLGERFIRALPWLVLAAAALLVGLAYTATRRLARQLARPIEGLVGVAEALGRGDPLPEVDGAGVREVRVLDAALRDAAAELDAARERAVAAERVRVWGEMARRVAHEMKNPLTPLRMAGHRLKRLEGRVEDEDGRLAEVLEVIDQEVGRLEELAARFSQLGRPPEGAATEVDVREMMASLLETDVPAGVASTLEAPELVPPVRAHYDALFRAFRNLVRNAVEAATTAQPRGHQGAGATEGGEGGVRVGPWVGVEIDVEPGDGVSSGNPWVVVRIQDNGMGLPPDAADRIFEPDFTTKTRGTGLGLALVRQAVTADGGTVDAVHRDDGAELVVRLPAAGAETLPKESHEDETTVA